MSVKKFQEFQSDMRMWACSRSHIVLSFLMPTKCQHCTEIAQAVKEERERCVERLVEWGAYHIKDTTDKGGSGKLVSAIYDQAKRAIETMPPSEAKQVEVKVKDE